MMALPTTQLAGIMTEKGKAVAVSDHPVPTAGLKQGQVLVKMHFASVCGSDFVYWNWGGWIPEAPTPFPLVGGHEGAGEIIAIGPNTGDVKIGDRVGIWIVLNSCDNCEFCWQGLSQHCLRVIGPVDKVPKEPWDNPTIGSDPTNSGTFQQYIVAYAKYIIHLPANVPYSLAAPVSCAGLGGYGLIKDSNTKPGDWIVVVGAGGGVGHFALQFAVNAGLNVIAIDTGDEKKNYTLERGAKAFIDYKAVTGVAIVDAVKKLTPGGLGAHAVVVASHNPDAYTYTLQYTRIRGTVCPLGLPSDCDWSVRVFDIAMGSKRIVGTYIGNRADLSDALNLVAAGKVIPKVTVFPLKNVQDAFQARKNNLLGRAVLQCFEDQPTITQITK